MRKLTFSLVTLTLLLAACSKDNTTTKPVNNNGNNPNNTSPYYFKFKFDGTDYNLNANFPQYMPFYYDEAGGYQVGDLQLFPSVGLRLNWPSGDTVTESELLSLKGKTLYFNDKNVQPELNFDKEYQDGTWYSVDTGDKAFNIKIDDITFLKKDTTMGYAVKTYVVTGSCNAVMERNDTMKAFSNGQFNFVISRQDW